MLQLSERRLAEETKGEWKIQDVKKDRKLIDNVLFRYSACTFLDWKTV